VLEGFDHGPHVEDSLVAIGVAAERPDRQRLELGGIGRLAAPADRHDGSEPFGMGRGQVPASVTTHGQAGQDHAMRIGSKAGHHLVQGLQGGVAVIRAAGPRLPRLGTDDQGRHAMGTVEDRRAEPHLRGRNSVLTAFAGTM
jgi:hypothetical protein